MGVPRRGQIEAGEETPAQAAIRECAEEIRLRVLAHEIIGHRVHPGTGQPITFIACTATSDDDPRGGGRAR